MRQPETSVAWESATGSPQCRPALLAPESTNTTLRCYLCASTHILQRLLTFSSLSLGKKIIIIKKKSASSKKQGKSHESTLPQLLFAMGHVKHPVPPVLTAKEKAASAESSLKCTQYFYSVVMHYLWQVIEIDCCFAGDQQKKSTWDFKEEIGVFLHHMDSHFYD